MPRGLAASTGGSLRALYNRGVLGLSSVDGASLGLRCNITGLSRLDTYSSHFSAFRQGTTVCTRRLDSTKCASRTHRLLRFTISYRISGDDVCARLTTVCRAKSGLSKVLRLRRTTTRLTPFPRGVVLRGLGDFRP